MKALRLPYYPTALLILVVGVSVAVHESRVSYLVVWMVIGNLLLHSACSLINEYSDFMTGADLVEYPKTTWKIATGGSKVLVDHEINPQHVLYVSLSLFMLSSFIWIVLSLRTDYVVIPLVSFSLAVTFLYSAAVSKGGFYLVRELLLAFGAVPLLTISVVKILSGIYSFTALAAGLVVGMQMMNYLLYHGLLDLEADSQSGKLRITRVLGMERTVQISEALTVGTFVLLAGSLYCRIFPLGCALPFALTPLGAQVVYREKKRIDLLHNYGRVVLLFVGTSLLLSLGFLLQ